MPTDLKLLQKLQEGAALNDATVMLEGNNFRIKRSDGSTQLWEPTDGGGLVLLEQMDPYSTPADVKLGGSGSAEDAINQMAISMKDVKESEALKAAQKKELEQLRQKHDKETSELKAKHTKDTEDKVKAKNPPAPNAPHQSHK